MGFDSLFNSKAQDALSKGFKVIHYSANINNDEGYSKNFEGLFRSFSFSELIRYIYSIDTDVSLCLSTYLGNDFHILMNLTTKCHDTIIEEIYNKTIEYFSDDMYTDIGKKLSIDNTIYSLSAVLYNSIDISFSEMLSMPSHMVVITQAIKNHIYTYNEKEMQKRKLSNGEVENTEYFTNKMQ